MNGFKASMVTIHGEIDVPQFFARNGPSGTYSHFWMSRAKTEGNYASRKKKKIGTIFAS